MEGASKMTRHLVVTGDSRQMDRVPDNSVHLVVTSPPYWNLKDYGNDEAIGQSSSTYEAYLSSICEVFSECVKKLTPDGKLIVNIMPILERHQNLNAESQNPFLQSLKSS